MVDLFCPTIESLSHNQILCFSTDKCSCLYSANRWYQRWNVLLVLTNWCDQLHSSKANRFIIEIRGYVPFYEPFLRSRIENCRLTHIAAFFLLSSKNGKCCVSSLQSKVSPRSRQFMKSIRNRLHAATMTQSKRFVTIRNWIILHPNWLYLRMWRRYLLPPQSHTYA